MAIVDIRCAACGKEIPEMPKIYQAYQAMIAQIGNTGIQVEFECPHCKESLIALYCLATIRTRDLEAAERLRLEGPFEASPQANPQPEGVAARD